MKKYQRPTEQFFCLPNNIFDLHLTPIQFLLYAYLVSSSGSKGYCWPRQETISAKTGIGATSVQKHLKILEQRKLISVGKHTKPYGYPNNEYTLLSLDNPEIYRDIDEKAEALPLSIEGEISA